MSNPLWTCQAVLAATGGKLSGDGETAFGSVAIDSRTLEPDALFVAIKGERLDGHAFVDQALSGGAAGAIVSQADAAVPGKGSMIRVADTLAALNALGRAARARTGAKVVAVTGSVGKTSTKEALRLAFEQAGRTHASRKSFNNQWGVPLSLANMAQETQFGVFEVGMNHAGEIEVLVDLIRPDIAIVTTVEPVHLEFFSSVEAIAEAKAEIFIGLVQGGTAILNRDSAYFELLRDRAKQHGAGAILDFGFHEEAFARLLDAELGAEGSMVEAMVGGQKLSYRVGAPGRHQVLNSLTVLAACHAAEIDVAKAASALAGHQAQKGRGARFIVGEGEQRVAVIDESYNANPASMRAAFEAMAQTPRGEFPRRVAVIGDMLELGDDGPALHRDLAAAVDGAGVDIVFACGPLMAGLFDALPGNRQGGYAPSSSELAEMVVDAVTPGDVVMIKGSLGSRMEPIVEALRQSLTRRISS